MEEKQIFLEDLEDQYRNLQEINNILIHYDRTNDLSMKKEIAEETFRIIHQIKATLGFLNFENEFKLFHKLESEYLTLISDFNDNKLSSINLEIEKIVYQLLDERICVDKRPQKDEQSTDILKILLMLKRGIESNSLFNKTKINIISDNYRFSQKICSSIFKITHQIVLNAIVHGTKTEGIIINIYLSFKDDVISIDISNNGFPIDFKQLKFIANSRKLNYESEEELLSLGGISSLGKANKYAGRGTGLNYVAQLIKRYNGKMQVESQNEYTNFHIQLRTKISQVQK